VAENPVVGDAQLVGKATEVVPVEKQNETNENVENDVTKAYAVLQAVHTT